MSQRYEFDPNLRINPDGTIGPDHRPIGEVRAAEVVLTVPEWRAQLLAGTTEARGLTEWVDWDGTAPAPPHPGIGDVWRSGDRVRGWDGARWVELVDEWERWVG
jgi:hypothetical protein